MTINWNARIKVGDRIEAPALIDGAFVVAVFRDRMGSHRIVIEEPDHTLHVCCPWDVTIVRRKRRARVTGELSSGAH